MKTAHDGCYAVVTGASQGLGAAFAEACALRGWNLVLAALPDDGFKAFGEDLRKRFGVDVLTAGLDLSRPDDQREFVRFAAAGKRQVGLLVNNVGIGSNGLFDLIPEELQRRAIDVNIQSTVALTYGLIPSLAAARLPAILTVASLSAFYPMPLFAVYAASKAFLLNWSLALRHELRPLGIGVTALAPGGIYTNEETREKVRAQGLGGRLSSMEPSDVAKLALDGAKRGDAIVIPGAFNRILRNLGTLVPRDVLASLIFSRWKKNLGRVEGAGDAAWYGRVETAIRAS